MAVASLALVMGARATAAQVETIQPLSPTSDALAAQMRVLGADPKNVPALIEAGELTLKLGDPVAAARFFARAERLDPRNGRLKAGEASALVYLERPGEALRLFQEAEALGADSTAYAAAQALALDLVGQQTRAQRAYRLALKAGREDETERRYALSLAISGQREAALEQIDAQLRRSDRAAWRVRAFVLAMTGDVAGANRIATAILPASIATGLAPFLDRLGRLGPVDRAFAVHFGEVAPTAERLADARLAPTFPVLAPERVAVAEPPKATVAASTKRAVDKRVRRAEPGPVKVALAALQARAASTATPSPLPPPPDERSDDIATTVAATALAKVAAAPQGTGSPPVGRARSKTSASAAGLLVSASPIPSPGAASSVGGLAVVSAKPSAPAQVATIVPATASVPSTAAQIVAPATNAPDALTPAGIATTAQASIATDQPEKREPPAAPVVVASAVPLPTPPAIDSPPGEAAASTTVASVQPPAQPEVGKPLAMPPDAEPVVASVAEPIPVATTSAPTAVRSPPGRQPAPVGGEDSILAKIIAGIGVPASELGVGPVRPAAPAIDTGAATNLPSASPPDAPAPSLAQVTSGGASAKRLAGERAAAAKIAADKKAADRKLAEKKLADAKALIDKKAADNALTDKKATDKAAAEKKAADKKAADKKAGDKLAADKKAADEKGAKANPSRIWVQVSGGANVRDLPKAWASVRDKAPALKGKSAWTTPLRFTNRLLTGPFSSSAEAQAFVNTLSKSGVSTFVFTSDKGQPVARVPTP